MRMFNRKAPRYQNWEEPAFYLDTSHLSWLARLFYRALLQRAWYLSTRPDLPDDDTQLRNLLGGVPENIWSQEQAAVRGMFRSEIVNGNPVLFQARLRSDWEQLETYRAQQAEFGKKAAHAKHKEEGKEEERKEGKEVGPSSDPEGTLRPPSPHPPLSDGTGAESAAQAESGALPRPPAGAISLAPDPSLFLTSKASQESQPPASEAVRAISTAVYRVSEGRPFPGDIQLLLDKGYTANEIAQTFEEYKRNQIDDWAEAHAIQNFFKPDESGMQTGEIACGVYRERAAKEAARIRVPIPR